MWAKCGFVNRDSVAIVVSLGLTMFLSIASKVLIMRRMLYTLYRFEWVAFNEQHADKAYTK